MESEVTMDAPPAPLERAERTLEQAMNDAYEGAQAVTTEPEEIAPAVTSHWDSLPTLLRTSLLDSGNLLWSEAVKALTDSYQPPPLYKKNLSYARLANLGSLVNIPKPNNDVNKRICVVHGDLTALRTEAYIVPVSPSLSGAGGSEVNALVHAKAGPQLQTELKRIGATLRMGESCLTRAYNIGADTPDPGTGLVYPMFLLHTLTPKTEDSAALKSCYERALYIALSEELRTIATPILAGVPYPTPGIPYYPLVGSIHVMLSVLRSWLDRQDVRDRVDLFIVCCATDREANVMQELMPLYFPRDYANEEPDPLNNPPPPPVEEPPPEKPKSKAKSRATSKKSSRRSAR
ncbi:Macro domain-containing protein [Giardia muris]|uniref:Macro domain-containing protein n=1 Tax=Giardia muris TaxID=5742 RepID=A0A4Z1T5Q0_GIAMU|nr:Macro domain-containing protein [Giardia muris]|eukprot:TNJ29383.1 Macro domain-containing protein [Giardia muris]